MIQNSQHQTFSAGILAVSFWTVTFSLLLSSSSDVPQSVKSKVADRKKRVKCSISYIKMAQSFQNGGLCWRGIISSVDGIVQLQVTTGFLSQQSCCYFLNFTTITKWSYLSACGVLKFGRDSVTLSSSSGPSSSMFEKPISSWNWQQMCSNSQEQKAQVVHLPPTVFS